MMAEKDSTVTILVMTVAPAFDPVAWVNISMNGYPVGLFTAAVMSPMQNKTATIMANARTPLMARLPIIVHGTTVEAFLISSHICSHLAYFFDIVASCL